MVYIPYCKNLSGVKIITGYNNTTTHTGTVTFPTTDPFTVIPYIFITGVYTGAGSYINNTTSRSISGFTYAKYYNGNGSAAGEPFYWMAIGKISGSGNVPFVKDIDGVQIIGGYNNTNEHIGTITFPTTNPFTETPYVHMTFVTGTAGNFTINLRTVSTTNFTYGKFYTGNNSAAGEDFYWIAIGKKAGSGNVPIFRNLMPGSVTNTTILVGDYDDATAASTGTITFSTAFGSIPYVLLNINRGGYDVGYTINLTSVSATNFGFVKNYNVNSYAVGERFQWMAIGE